MSGIELFEQFAPRSKPVEHASGNSSLRYHASSAGCSRNASTFPRMNGVSSSRLVMKSGQYVVSW